MAHCDAAGVNGSNRMLSRGVLLPRMMPNGFLGSPVIVLLFGLDIGLFMDVGPRYARSSSPAYARLDLGIELDGMLFRTAATRLQPNERPIFQWHWDAAPAWLPAPAPMTRVIDRRAAPAAEECRRGFALRRNLTMPSPKHSP